LMWLKEDSHWQEQSQIRVNIKIWSFNLQIRKSSAE
jgi:hypothetical protein